ncbi:MULTISPECIES: TetR/AcrR family transcriptional regulator [Thomasclavelia]|uniref:Transcriptional regulator, TetR family n=4 Tax=Thomasclavelia ramosa TaxID=1547 RepID=B0N3T0_9FIRM|nr:TetR/AcrR family transcriptional regulator [Thomasclavelia ramosa]EDS19102.1 transcriptional regulator, TetR family [Thomasclavelia ramosa DSM 1402]MDB7085712.1 TetR/AcrR family transcriptional regulator [Thomasclavelia ramosa]MDC2834115.1 TetR/AcrR family transcriptional regulator [Thomasclavelia ramosa]MDO5873012.1 TetR/AcrR family transcriptional regulator [Thomasclavelia ramosa]MDO5901505.1 TetR/AcrR family transcriptional regulator [Thomasclavelia ramosa]
MKRDDEMTSQRFNKTIERKKEIIKAAMQLFSEKGYAQTSMRDIARTMGVSLGLCYRYFDSKQILFNTAIDLYIEECCNSYLAILHDSTITIKDKIDALFTSIGDEHSNMQYYDFFHRVENEELHEQLSIKLCKYMYPHLLEAVKKAIAAKEIYIENPEALISFIIYGQVGLLSKSNIDHHEVAKLLNQYVNQLMKFNP